MPKYLVAGSIENDAHAGMLLCKNDTRACRVGWSARLQSGTRQHFFGWRRRPARAAAASNEGRREGRKVTDRSAAPTSSAQAPRSSLLPPAASRTETRERTMGSVPKAQRVPER
eukprot:4037863-Pyramimonas_sp.AAC.1